MGCRESIFGDKSIIDFPIFLLFFNTKSPIFPIFSILSFLFSYFFEQPWRWTPCSLSALMTYHVVSNMYADDIVLYLAGPTVHNLIFLH